MTVSVRKLTAADCKAIAVAFEEIGWSDHKPLSRFERYYSEQNAGVRDTLVADVADKFAGYATIFWKPSYHTFVKDEIPEVQDLNVLPQYRRRSVATTLMDRAETIVSARSNVIGIGVGMYADYGDAQRLYVKRGYVPDGRGLTYRGQVIRPMESVLNDDDLVLYFTKSLNEALA